MTDERPKRPGTMSDDERALVGLDRRRTPPRGTPVQPEDRDAFTPVTDLLDLIDDPKLRRIVRMMWEHTANVELRSEERAGKGVDVSALVEDLAALRTEAATKFADIHGASGTNGKLGELRRRVDGLSSKAWWILTAFVGGIGAAAVKLVIVTSAFTEMRDRSLHHRDEIRLLQAQVQTLQSALIARDLTPAVEPEKAPSQ